MAAARLRGVLGGTAVPWEVQHPLRESEVLASVELDVVQVREMDYQADELVLTIKPGRKGAGSNVLWQLSVRLMVALCPSEQDWDRSGDTFATIAEPGYLADRLAQLDSASERGELLPSEPGTHKHWAHRRGLDDAVVFGDSVRSMCGVYFVPTQDHEGKPQCVDCQYRYDELSTTITSLPE